MLLSPSWWRQAEKDMYKMDILSKCFHYLVLREYCLFSSHAWKTNWSDKGAHFYSSDVIVVSSWHVKLISFFSMFWLNLYLMCYGRMF